MNWRTTLGVLLLAAAILSGWSAWRQRPNPAPTASTELRSDYVLRDFTLVSLDKDGKEAATLQAPELQRQRGDRTLSIVTPLFLLPDAQGRHWELRARTGWVSADGNEIRLRGDVAGDSPKADGVEPTTLRTASLDAFPDQNLLRSADKVTLTRPGIMQTGVGFESRLDTRQYMLLSQVKTRYEPRASR